MNESFEWMVAKRLGIEKVHMEGLLVTGYILLAALVLHARRNVS